METVQVPLWAYNKLMADLRKITEVDRAPEFHGEHKYAKMAGFARGMAESALNNLPLAIRQAEILKAVAS